MSDDMTTKAVVLLSGGIDSSTAAYWAKAREWELYPLLIDYGQRHRCELESAAYIAGQVANATRTTILTVPMAQWAAPNALTDRNVEVPHGHYEDKTMRDTVVPYRNMLFVLLAAMVAKKVGATRIVIGVHAGDHAVYPDCRTEAIKAMAQVLAVADYGEMTLHAPFGIMNKAEIVLRAKKLGVPIERTWTCYEGGERPCGRCGACVERREATEAIYGVAK